MLKIEIGEEVWNEKDEIFMTIVHSTLELEHSLAALSKWESYYKKPFLGEEERTTQEVYFYIRCMNTQGEVDPAVYERLTEDHLHQITNFIQDEQTATWFADTPAESTSQIITSELIYYWMFSLQIPLECEHWHLGRLFTLIRVFSAQNAPKKKMSDSEVRERHQRLNAQRRGPDGSG